MNQETTRTTPHPSITKNTASSAGEIRTHHLSRCVIGYLLSGEKQVYYGDAVLTISPGDLFFLGIGNHHTREVATDTEPYAEIMVRYSATELQELLQRLTRTHKITVPGGRSCEKCDTHNHLAMPALTRERIFFHNLDECLQAHVLQQDAVARELKMTELLYWVVTRDDCCLLGKLLRDVDSSRDNFQQVVYDNIFTNIPVDELARLCNRSLTSFKHEFARVFKLSPHQWFIRQRLIHARLLLISTGKSISRIGSECAFPNISHFIKLFRKQYDMTPAQYRAKHRND